MLLAVEAAVEPLGQPYDLLSIRVLCLQSLLLFLSRCQLWRPTSWFRSSLGLRTLAEPFDCLEAVYQIDDFVQG